MILLCYTAKGRYNRLSQLLLETGRINHDVKDKDGVTQLCYAAKSGHDKAVQKKMEPSAFRV